MYGFSKFIPGIAGFSAIIIFIRFLGSETYGQYSLILAQCNLLVAFCFGWLNQSQLRYLEMDKQHDQFSISLITSFIVSSITGATILIILLWSGHTTSYEFNVSLICIGSIACFTLIKTLYQSSINPGHVISITSVQSVLAILLPLSIIFIYDKTSTAMLFGVSLSFLLVSSWVIIRNIKLWPSNIFSLIKKFQKNDLVNKWLRFGVPISLWFAFGLALPYLDRLFIAHFLTLKDLGAYAGLQELLTRMFSFLTFPLIMALHPRIMNLWNQAKYRQVVNLLKIGLLTLLGVFVLIILLTQIFNEELFKLLQWVIPEISLKFKPLVMPLLIAGFFWQLSFLTHKMLELEEKTMLMAFFILLALLINIIGNILFIPIIGVLATAYTAATSAIVYCLLTATFSVNSLIKQKYKQ
tara:strand:- start:87 stop:1319 length:1233 start_codon:yes stop_codon:yes gene_type:complete